MIYGHLEGFVIYKQKLDKKRYTMGSLAWGLTDLISFVCNMYGGHFFQSSLHKAVFSDKQGFYNYS